MMWIFEWDIVTGDSAALDSIYAVSRDDLESAIADGPRRGRRRRGDARPGRRDRPRPRGAPRSCTSSFVDALDYETDLLGTLAPTARRSCGTRSGSTPAARPPTTSGAQAERRVPDGARRARRPLRRRRRPARLQLHRRRPGQRPRRPRPGDGLAGPGPARRLAAVLVLGHPAGAGDVLRVPAPRPCGRCSSAATRRGGSPRCRSPAPAPTASSVWALPGAGARREPGASTPGSPRPPTSS